MERPVNPRSKPKMMRQNGERFPACADGWDARLRLAIRHESGMVLTWKQCLALADALGWNTSPTDTEAA